MRIHRLPRAILLCITIICSISHSNGQGSEARFLLIQTSPAENALGGAGIALIRNSYESFNNPAALAYCPSLDVSWMSQQQRPENTDNVHAALAVGFRIDSVTGGSVSYNRIDWGDFKQIDDQGRVLGIISPRGLQLSICAGTELMPQLMPNLSVGICVNYIDYTLVPAFNPNTTAIAGRFSKLTFSCGVGVLLRRVATMSTLFSDDDSSSLTKGHAKSSEYDNGFSFAFSAINLGPPEFRRYSAESLPMCFRLGSTYTIVNKRNIGGLFCLDAESRPLDGSVIDYLHTGLQLEIFKTIILRGGYSAALIPELQSHFSFGFGAHYSFFHLYYAHYTPSILSVWQTGISLKWDFK